MTTQTETPPQTDEVALLDELLAQAAPEPKNPAEASALREAEVGGESVPMGTVVTSAGHIVVYSTKTGETSLLNKNMLPWINPANTYAWRFEDGTICFTTVKPTKVTPIVGTILCVLHSDYEHRAHYDEIGLKGVTCRKKNLMSIMDQESHGAGKHSREWKIIVRDREQRERDEDRAIQRSILELASRSASAPVQTSDPVNATEISRPDASPNEVVLKDESLACDLCDVVLTGRSVAGAHSSRRAHMKKEHPNA